MRWKAGQAVPDFFKEIVRRPGLLLVEALSGSVALSSGTLAVLSFQDSMDSAFHDTELLAISAGSAAVSPIFGVLTVAARRLWPRNGVRVNELLRDSKEKTNADSYLRSRLRR